LINKGEIKNSIYPKTKDGKTRRRVLRSDFWQFVRDRKLRLPPGVRLPMENWLVISDDRSLTYGLALVCHDKPIGPPKEVTNWFDAGLELAGAAWFGYILLDADLGSMNLMRAIAHFRNTFPEQPFGVVVPDGEYRAVDYQRAGAMHVWRKPVSFQDVANAIIRARTQEQ